MAREEPVAHPVVLAETLGIFVLFALFYTLLGFHIVADLHVVNFDALDRLTRAFMVWYNDPPKLASIGFSLPPIGSFVLVPFAAVREFVTSGLALPLSSGLFAAGALVFFNRMFAMADMPRAARLVLVALIGFNPMFAFYAMNGTGDAAYFLFAAFGLFCLVGWGRNGSARFLIGAGLAFALAALTKYEFIVWAFFIAFMIAWTLNNRDRSKEEVEASTIAYMAPVGYALGLWIFFNAIVLGNPLDWISLASNATPVNAISSPTPGFDLVDGLLNALRVQLIFPVTLVMIPLLVMSFGDTRKTMSVGFAMLISISVLYPLIGAAVEGSIDVIELRDALPAMMAGIAGFAWLYFKSVDLRGAGWVLMVVLSLIALPAAWSQMKSYPHQNLEQAFTRAIETNEDQEGTSSRGGFQVGIAPERTIAEFIDEAGIPNNQVLTDNARTYGVISLSGHPEQFFDRVDRGDEIWQAVVADPVGKVEYALVENNGADLILDAYPGALDGEEPILQKVVGNDRYTLFKVSDASPSAEGSGSEWFRNGGFGRLRKPGRLGAAAQHLAARRQRALGRPLDLLLAARAGSGQRCSVGCAGSSRP